MPSSSIGPAQPCRPSRLPAARACARWRGRTRTAAGVGTFLQQERGRHDQSGAELGRLPERLVQPGDQRLRSSQITRAPPIGRAASPPASRSPPPPPTPPLLQHGFPASGAGKPARRRGSNAQPRCGGPPGPPGRSGEFGAAVPADEAQTTSALAGVRGRGRAPGFGFGVAFSAQPRGSARGCASGESLLSGELQSRGSSGVAVREMAQPRGIQAHSGVRDPPIPGGSGARAPFLANEEVRSQTRIATGVARPW